MVSRENVALGLGLMCIAVGCFFGLTWESILDWQVTKEFVLTKNSKTFEAFSKTKIPLYIKFHFWNWTNPSDMKDPDYKVEVSEMGPYVYKEVTEKTAIVWNENGTISYKRRRHWYFVPEMSNGTLDDVVTTLNVVAQSATFITRNYNLMTRYGLDIAIRTTQSLAVSRPVREHLFDGIPNSLMETAHKLPMFAKDVPFDRFGWFYKRNGTEVSDGYFNVETGSNGIERFGEINTWNYKNATPFYRGECTAVKGSGGDFFPPRRTKDQLLELFSPDLCRHVGFRYTREQEMSGIKLYRYELGPDILSNGYNDSETACFCSQECLPPGALNVSACRMGAPAFVSYPHYMDADPSYTKDIIGMKPDRKIHGSHFLIEPRYGIPFQVEARLQINILVQPYHDIRMFHGIKKVFFPMMWFEQTADITQDTIDTVKMLLNLPLIGMIVAAALIVIGTIVTITSLILIYLRKKKTAKISQAISPIIEPMLKDDLKANGHTEEIITRL